MHVLVTGASSGIGEALARPFSSRGDQVSLVARSVGKLETLATELGRAQVISADLTVLDSIDGVVDRAEAGFGPVDICINNAGIQIVAQTVDVPVDEGERLLRLNLLAPLRLHARVLPGMIERGHGAIVDVASLAGIAPTLGMVHYSASKAGLAAASEALRAEVAKAGVHVVTVYPGPVETNMAAAAMDRYDAPPAMLPTGTVEGLAKRVVRAVERKRDRVIYPEFYAAARHLPGATRWVMDRFSPVPKKR